MKSNLSFALALLAFGAVEAFQPASPARRISTTDLSISQVEEAIAEAQAASDKYGASSPEAALAWEAVEEMDSRDNSAAYQANRAKLMSGDELVKATKEYEANLKTVQRLTKELAGHQKHMNDVAREMQALKLTPPELRPAPKSKALEAAVSKAKAASEEHGKASPEARLAWEEVEEIAAAGLGNSMGDDMTEECLLETAEICLALEEVDRFINYEKIQEGGLSNF